MPMTVHVIWQPTTIIMEINVTRFYKTVSNRTFGKIKVTPPVDSYTIVLLVLTLGTAQGGVESSNGGFRPCEGSGLIRISCLLVDDLINVGQTFFLWILLYISH